MTSQLNSYQCVGAIRLGCHSPLMWIKVNIVSTFALYQLQRCVLQVNPLLNEYADEFQWNVLYLLIHWWRHHVREMGRSIPFATEVLVSNGHRSIFQYYANSALMFYFILIVY